MRNLKNIGVGLLAFLSLATLSGCYGPGYYTRGPGHYYAHHRGYWR